VVKIRRNIEDPHYNYKATGIQVTRTKDDVTGYSEQKLFSQHQANDEVKELQAIGYKIYFD